MNIFVLDTDPVKAAQAQFDKHVVRMVLESAQLLCSAFPQGAAPYRRTHYNHPCAVWTRQSYANFAWLVDHGLALADEYEHRYNKVHKSREVIQWCLSNADKAEFATTGQTPFALAMPDEYKSACPVESYRAYYRGAKAAIAAWNKTRPAPEWWTVAA